MTDAKAREIIDGYVGFARYKGERAYRWFQPDNVSRCEVVDGVVAIEVSLSGDGLERYLIEDFADLFEVARDAVTVEHNAFGCESCGFGTVVDVKVTLP